MATMTKSEFKKHFTVLVSTISADLIGVLCSIAVMLYLKTQPEDVSWQVGTFLFFVVCYSLFNFFRNSWLAQDFFKEF